MFIEGTQYYKSGFYDFAAEVEYSIDNNYGADADGTRGQKIYILDSLELHVFDKEGDEVLNQEIIDLVCKNIMDNLENYV